MKAKNKPILKTNDGGSIEDIYSKMEHKQHILTRPGTYIGSIQPETREMYVIQNDIENDEEETKSTTTSSSNTNIHMIKKNITFVSGLYKLFDEGLVNMRDHYIRMNQMIDEQKKIKKGELPENPKIDINRTYHIVKNIEVDIDIDNNTITMTNDGEGIDVAYHNVEKMYVPELIFGNLLSGTNFDENQKRVVGGMNGYGAKLINLFSLEFIIETLDVYRKKKYVQKFTQNMSLREEPKITSSTRTNPYTKITFKPDLARFGLKSLHDDNTVDLMIKRVYDLVAVTGDGVNVKLNGKKIGIKNFERYVDLYIGSRGNYKRQYLKVNENWEIAICAGEFDQISFVNGICTYDGGKHVDYIVNQLCTKMVKFAQENKKGFSGITAKSIRENIIVFINSTIVNPEFKSQTKEALTTTITNFGSRCEIPDEFIEKCCATNMNVLESAMRLDNFKADKTLKKTDGKKVSRVNNERLTDAHYAGTAKSVKCTLILCEGESAKTFAVSGLNAFELEERKYYGILPLKGKIINPKDCSITSVEKNQQFGDLKQALGLKQDTDYYTDKTQFNTLRYGKVLIITDADVDGDHIKGLVFNLFHEFWPSLLKIEGFFCSILTEIVILTNRRTGEKKSFYSVPEYENWKKNRDEDELSKWDANYYKGLGTHTDNEAKERFGEMKLQLYTWHDISRFLEKENKDTTNNSDNSDNSDNSELNLNDDRSSMASSEYLELYHNYYKRAVSDTDTHTHTHIHPKNQNKLKSRIKSKSIIREDAHLCDLAIDLAFRKKLTNYRKGWITNYLHKIEDGNIDLYLHKQEKLSYIDFINEKLINFSVYNNERSIPSIMDGLKPSQRKVLYGTLKKNVQTKLKVAQLTGYIAENTAYHHGEESLNKTIISMAQDYTGANNLNLLVPQGQFGSRLYNGDDSASPRYIFTHLNPITRLIFNKDDEKLLTYLDDDGTPIEPKYFVPTIPMILVNGTKGMGVGWSTDIPCYNPKDIIENIKRYLKGDELLEMTPWYRGFKGMIEPLVFAGTNEVCGYKIHGIYKRISDCEVEITEIPVESLSFNAYEKFLKNMLFQETTSNMFEDIICIAGNKTIYAKIIFKDKKDLDKLLNKNEDNEFEKFFKLSKTISITNMHLFNTHGIMTKYFCPEDILREFCGYRFSFYNVRKNYLIKKLEDILTKAQERIRFIRLVNDEKEEFDIRNRKKVDIIKDLKKLKFRTFTDDRNKVDADGHGHGDKDDDDDDDDNNKGYNYLLDMPLYSLTLERIRKLEKEANDAERELTNVQETTIEQMWSNDLTDLDKQLQIFEEEWEKKFKGAEIKDISSSKKGKTKNKK